MYRLAKSEHFIITENSKVSHGFDCRGWIKGYISEVLRIDRAYGMRSDPSVTVFWSSERQY